jgi:FkbM family methyltransferase
MNRSIARSSKLGALCHIKSQGFTPATVIDVGVQKGTPELYAVFPESFHLLIEPVAEQEVVMRQICESLPRAEYVLAAAGARTATSNLRVSHNAMYSNLTTAEDKGDAMSSVRTVPTVALDDLASSRNFEAPILLKIDVDGQEVDVLNGAKRVLREKVEYVIVESTLFGQINEVIKVMVDNEFAIYDILEPAYRRLDGALWQVDLVFVRKDGQFRGERGYASDEEMRKLKVS